LLEGGGFLKDEDKYAIGFEVALGNAREGLKEELRATVDPAKVRFVLLMSLVTYMALLAFPDVLTKGAAATLGLGLSAYIGVRAVWHLVSGYLEMRQEIEAATSFAEVEAAGRRYGLLMGEETARVLVATVTALLTQGGMVSRLMGLPNAAQASAALAADSGGLTLAGAGAVEGVLVTPSGMTVIVSQAAAASGSLSVAMSLHHIATNKNDVSSARGGPWSPQFREIFEKAGMSLEDPENVVDIAGHGGPHSAAYHQEVMRRLSEATEACQGVDSCREALVSALRSIARELVTPGSELNKLLTKS